MHGLGEETVELPVEFATLQDKPKAGSVQVWTDLQFAGDEALRDTLDVNVLDGIDYYVAGEFVGVDAAGKTVRLEASDGEVRRCGVGSVTLVEDTKGKGHRSRVVGSNTVLGVVVQLGG